MSEPDGAVSLGGLEEAVARRLDRFDAEDVSRRIWEHDPTVWADPDTPEITNRLGWLTLPGEMGAQAERLDVLAEEARQFERVALIGMGGSSLAPEVYQSVFGNAPGHPELIVLDSTHPRAVLEYESVLDLDTTLFLVSSKSGSTLETMSLYRYFWYRTGQSGDQFIALTDPGSSLQYLAEERGFRHIFSTNPDVGGRYSALTFFGLVPAALIGVDVRRLLGAAASMATACGPEVAADEHPGLLMGAFMGESALAGRDKLTIVTDERFDAFPEWLEQLVAESTGKDDTGILPVANEPPAAIPGSDRSYLVYGAPNGASRSPSMFFTSEPYALGAEMYRAEYATAVAGSVLRIQPFDQPNVEAAKVFAREAMAAREPTAVTGSLEVMSVAEARPMLTQLLETAVSGDYVALQAYLPNSPGLRDGLQTLRGIVGASGLATTAGVGPRYLHSTGQLHKGGANNGIFVQVVDRDRPHVPVPETNYTFGDVIEAQALGDAQALADRDRRLLRVHIDEPAALADLVP